MDWILQYDYTFCQRSWRSVLDCTVLYCTVQLNVQQAFADDGIWPVAKGRHGAASGAINSLNVYNCDMDLLRDARVFLSLECNVCGCGVDMPGLLIARWMEGVLGIIYQINQACCVSST